MYHHVRPLGTDCGETLPSSQFPPQFPAGLQGLAVGRFMGHQAVFIVDIGVCRLTAGTPVPHPLPVTPAVGAEQRDLLPAQGPFQVYTLSLHDALPIYH